jgi:hypothetical protein
MTEKIIRATHQGILKIGDLSISCAVLADGTRILVSRSLANVLGRRGAGAYWKKKKESEKGALLPEYVSARYLEDFISPQLQNKLVNQRVYINLNNIKTDGLEATILPDICDVWIKANEKGALPPKQKDIAQKAYFLLKGIANVGITALVDEATGYQEVRDRLALQKILEKYISKELMPWQKRFPDPFYEEIFRLRNWQWKGREFNPPQIVGKYTNDIIYERLAPGVLSELRRINPPDEKGIRKHKHTQWLTVDVGHPKLNEHISSVMALMRASSNWNMFKRLLVRAFPKHGDQGEFLLEEED